MRIVAILRYIVLCSKRFGHFGTSAKMSGTLWHQILVPKCLGAEVPWGRSVRKAINRQRLRACNSEPPVRPVQYFYLPGRKSRGEQAKGYTSHGRIVQGRISREETSKWAKEPDTFCYTPIPRQTNSKLGKTHRYLVAARPHRHPCQHL